MMPNTCNSGWPAAALAVHPVSASATPLSIVTLPSGVGDDDAVADAGQRHPQLLALAEERRGGRGLLAGVAPDGPDERDRHQHAQQARGHACPGRPLKCGFRLSRPCLEEQLLAQLHAPDLKANRVHRGLASAGENEVGSRLRALAPVRVDGLAKLDQLHGQRVAQRGNGGHLGRVVGDERRQPAELTFEGDQRRVVGLEVVCRGR